MPMFDSHAHVMDSAFDEDRVILIQKLFASGIAGWMEVGTSVEESKKAIALAETEERIIASVGVHPNELAGLTEADWEQLAQLADHQKVKAIGEVGLDFSRGIDIEFQEAGLRKFITLAQEKTLPIIFHVRSGNAIDAHTELIRVLESYTSNLRPLGVIHTFSGTLLQAQKYIQLGMMISFSGVLTFKNAGELPEVAKSIPLESILVETDCPYLTPGPLRGKRNDPSLVKYVIQKVAQLRGGSVENIREITLNNAKKLFSI